jgi:hypothetical protein
MGTLVVGGAFIGVLADCLSGWFNQPNIMYTPFSFTLESFIGLFVEKPRWTYILGNYLAIVFLPLHIVGSFLVYLTIRPKK